MIKKEVLVLLTDKWADWEPAFAIAEVNSTDTYIVKTIAEDKEPKISIGGLRTAVDYTLDEYTNFDNLALLILPGGFAWAENNFPRIVSFIKDAQNQNIPIAAICGATIFLAKNGFLNTIYHTGDCPHYFTSLNGYTGATLYKAEQVVFDQNIITANETAAVDFAREIFKLLAIDTDEAIDGWYQNFKHGTHCTGSA